MLCLRHDFGGDLGNGRHVDIGGKRLWQHHRRCGSRGLGRDRKLGNLDGIDHRQWNTDRRQRGPGHHERHLLVVHAQGIGSLAECLRRPGCRRSRSDVLDPLPELAHGLAGQRQQRTTGRLLLGKPGIGQLLHRPSGFAKFGETHHARTALEGMEGAAQRGALAQISRVGRQRFQRLQTGLYDLARLFEEDLAHLGVVLVEVGRGDHRWRRRRHRSRGSGSGCHHGFHHRRCCHCGIDRVRHNLRHGHSHLGLRNRRLLAPHDRPQFAKLLVVHKQLLGQRALVTQHVDEETHRAQAVAELFEHFGASAASADFVDQEFFDAVAHAQCGQGRLVQAQHRKHAAHLRQLAGNLVQWHAVLGVAKELVQRLLDLAQGGTQFVDHAAHGLAIADAPVQLLHPGFQRLRLCPCGHLLQALCQPCAAFGHLRFGGIQVVVSRFQVQDRGGDFHGDRGGGLLPGANRGLDRARQGAGQVGALRVQLDHRVGYSCELVRGRLQTVCIPPRQCRPGLGRGRNTLARLHQQGRIEATELRRGIVHRPGLRQAIGLAHRHQGRNLRIGARGRLSTIKQQVLGQPVHHTGFAARQGGVLRNDTGRSALDVDVQRAQAVTHGLEKCPGKRPEYARLQLVGARGQAQADVGHGVCTLHITGPHDLQHRLVHTGANGRAIRQRLGGGRNGHLDPAPLGRPQVGRMHAFTSHQFQHLTVLREQRHRRRRLALQHAFEVFSQGKTGTLHLVCRIVAAQLGPLDKLLCQRLHDAQHFRGSAQTDHLEGTDRLVQLLARNPQLAGIQVGQVGTARQLSVTHEAAQGLGGAVERLAELVQDPRERPQVARGQFTFTRRSNVCLHLVVHSCQSPRASCDLEPRHRLAQLFGHA